MLSVGTDFKNVALDLAIRNCSLTPKQLSNALEISRSNLWRIINSKVEKPRGTSKKTIIELCAILRADPRQFGFEI